MSQIRDKKAHRKHIATMNPINAKSVQLIELHAFAYRLLSVYLSESFDFLKDNYYCISAYYIQLGTNMITLLRLLYISALARIEKLPQKNFNLV